jgi:hypothetical protein
MSRKSTARRRTLLPLLCSLAAAGCEVDPTIEATTVLGHDQCQSLEAGVTRVDWDTVGAWRHGHLLDAPGNGSTEEHDRDLLLIAISRGEQPTAGYRLDLTGVRREPGTAVIDVQWDTPEPDAMVAQVLTHPCLVIGLDETGIDGLNRVEARDQHGTVIGAISR